MIEGNKTYYLPDTTIDVDVTYHIVGESVVFQYAEIDGQELNCDMLGLQIDVTEKWNLVRKTKYISLKEWLQSHLDSDSDRIFMEHDIVVNSDYEEHFNQGSFV